MRTYYAGISVVTSPEVCSVSSSLRVASLYSSSRGSSSASCATGPVQHRGGQAAASRHRSAGLATSAVRLRRKGSQPQRKPANVAGEGSRQQTSIAEEHLDGTDGNGVEPKRHQSITYRQSAVSSAEDDSALGSSPSAQQAGQQTQQAIRQQSKAADGIQAAEWLTDNAPWVADQTPPSDGSTWPSDVRRFSTDHHRHKHPATVHGHEGVYIVGTADKQFARMQPFHVGRRRDQSSL